jgi:hypothetical protein
MPVKGYSNKYAESRVVIKTIEERQDIKNGLVFKLPIGLGQGKWW